MCTGTAFADTVTFQQGAYNQLAGCIYTGAEDTFLSSFYSYGDGSEGSVSGYDCNFGAYPTLGVGRVESYGLYGGCTSLIRFDVSALAQKRVQSARLYLVVQERLVGWSNEKHWLEWELAATPMPKEDWDWVAGSGYGTVEAGASCAAWKHYDQQRWLTSNWTGEPGTYHPPSSFYVAQRTSKTWAVTGDSNYRDRLVYIDLPASLVEQWVSGGDDNSGLILAGWDFNWALGGYTDTIYSCDVSNANFRPRLVVNYTTPEPSGLVVLLGGVGLVARRLFSAERKHR